MHGHLQLDDYVHLFLVKTASLGRLRSAGNPNEPTGHSTLMWSPSPKWACHRSPPHPLSSFTDIAENPQVVQPRRRRISAPSGLLVQTNCTVGPPGTAGKENAFRSVSYLIGAQMHAPSPGVVL